MNRVTRYQTLSSSIRKSHDKSLIGVVQCKTTSDFNANLEKNHYYITECVNRGASLVCLPEYFAYMNRDPGNKTGWSEPIWGPTINKYRKIALEHGCWLSLGGF